MKLKAILRNLPLPVKGSKEIEITGIATDSRTVVPGNLFVARKGTAANGADFIPQAVQSGAAAVVTDLFDPSCRATQILTPEPSSWEAVLAGRFYGHPSRELYTVGVTGTKGKTTVTYLIHHLFERLGISCGLIGTVETVVGRERRSSLLTTHGAAQNQKLLREMVSSGCSAVSLEVSSHGLDQGRVAGIEFDIALFTNLFPDHLDYHQTLERYAAAKKELFRLLEHSSKKKKRALVSAESPWSEWMLHGFKVPAWTFGIGRGDLSARDLALTPQGITFTVDGFGQQARCTLPLLGRFNVLNALAAIGVGIERGARLEEIGEALRDCRGAPGRLEKVENGRGVQVFVDYAHNGEALHNVLQTLRETGPRRILCVFGCGGNRDPARRREMAQAAEAWADLSILTSDNPRNEDPAAILREIAAAYRDPNRFEVEVDRKQAIERAIQMAGEGDIVLIAGKGHEKVQIFAHHTVPFDDVAVAQGALHDD
jgi:UDP-N-acetylmuramoyl-L-alanyl-D-glutamate--2,6-diaminopimelate ligase